MIRKNIETNGPRTPIFYVKGIKAYICKRDTFHGIRTNSTLVESLSPLSEDISIYTTRSPRNNSEP